MVCKLLSFFFFVIITVYYSSSTADGLISANITNLAIKGIISIWCMAEISHIMWESDDFNYYYSNASSLVSQWQTLAESSGHLTSTYGATNSWGLMYNLFYDKLLGFNLVDNSTIDCSTAQPFRLPFDSNQEFTAKSHWTLFSAGTVNVTNTRDSLVSMVHAAVSNLNNDMVFPITYTTSDGSTLGGSAR
ncbi:hypothetical protein GYMLUDRAFT_158341 [Collybiopsis luxurians FD-317 M1]|nr:hypothetical protein GYMLUDRAFT_158341 [Collybiopsis luxurians FD-317 M1]